MEEKLLNIINRYADIDPAAITPDTEIMSETLGLNSIAVYEMVGDIEDEFNISISDYKLSQIKTVGQLLDTLKEMKGE